MNGSLAHYQRVFVAPLERHDRSAVTKRQLNSHVIAISSCRGRHAVERTHQDESRRIGRFEPRGVRVMLKRGLVPTS